MSPALSANPTTIVLAGGAFWLELNPVNHDDQNREI
jgi:hypothetical protein